MLLIGYLYGIKSERRLEEEASLNLAYRWLCGIELTERVPDHSTFSQNMKRRFSNNNIFRDIFNKIVCQRISHGIVGGDIAVADGSFLPANISRESTYESIEKVNTSTVKYLDELERELSTIDGYKESEIIETEKRSLKSHTDVDCAYINQERKKGFGYLTEMTVDTNNGIITGVDCFPANKRGSDIILNHLKRQQEDNELFYSRIALDGGYDVGAVRRGLELLVMDGFTAIREYHNNGLKKGFMYDEATDEFICQKGKSLKLRKLIYKKLSQNYYRMYSLPRKECSSCESFSECSSDHGNVRINSSTYYPAFYRNRKKYKTPEYLRLMRLRKIWAEGTFSVLKREHNLKKISKRGILKATEECLLSATALNLKRLIRAV